MMRKSPVASNQVNKKQFSTVGVGMCVCADIQRLKCSIFGHWSIVCALWTMYLARILKPERTTIKLIIRLLFIRFSAYDLERLFQMIEPPNTKTLNMCCILREFKLENNWNRLLWVWRWCAQDQAIRMHWIVGKCVLEIVFDELSKCFKWHEFDLCDRILLESFSFILSCPSIQVGEIQVTYIAPLSFCVYFVLHVN